MNCFKHSPLPEDNKMVTNKLYHNVVGQLNSQQFDIKT